MANNIEYARLYADKGWYVLPVAGKVPLTKNGLKDATIDPSTLELWWGIAGKLKDSNIAIRTGAISGLVVVDIDRKAGGLESYEQMKSRFPTTPTVRTGGGGLHLYYKHPGVEVKNSASKIAPGIDIRGDNGYVVAPPSSHDSGNNYEWEIIPSDVPLATFPIEILPKDTSFDSTKLFTQGSKKTTTTQLAGHMRAIGAPINVIEAAVMAVDNGLTVEERLGIVRSASKWEIPLPPRTHVGQAEFLVMLFENRLAFDLGRNTWLIWNGHRWEPKTETSIYTYVKEGARYHTQRADMMPTEQFEEADKYKKWALSLESVNNIENVTKALKYELAKAYTLDTEPYLLGVPNGIVNLRDGTLMEGTPDQWVTLSTDVEYNPEAKAPRWEQFMREVFADRHGVERPELTDWVYRAVGYSITGERSQQCWFLCLGAGSNGKSTFLNTLRGILGQYSMIASVRSFVTDRSRSSINNDLAEMAGRRFLVASEAGVNAELDSERLKMLTTDIVRCRHLYEREFEFEPTLKLWIANNRRPRVTDDSLGFWRRVRLVPFDREFKIDHGLSEVLEDEAEGILAWCVRGAQEYLQRGLKPPDVVMSRTQEYQDSSDPLLQWRQAALIERRDAKLRAGDIYPSYQEWCLKNNINERERVGRRKISEYMVMNFDKGRDEAGQYYLGVELNT